FEAQRSQVSLERGFELAKNAIAGTIHSDVCRDIGGDVQRVHNISTDYNAIAFNPHSAPSTGTHRTGWLHSFDRMR
ncbi:MAG: hypothetical protein ACRC62_16105, partial [Microcoleus sp.]